MQLALLEYGTSGGWRGSSSTSWTTNCPSLRLTFSTSMKLSSFRIHPNLYLSSIHFSKPPLLNALLDPKALICFGPVASPMRPQTRRSRTTSRSTLIPSTTTRTKGQTPRSSNRSSSTRGHRQRQPDHPSPLPRKPPPHQTPLRNLLDRRLPHSHTSLTWWQSQNHSPEKMTPALTNLLFRGRSGSPVISSSRLSRRLSPN